MHLNYGEGYSMPTRKARRVNGAFLRKCRLTKIECLCADMDAQLAKRDFAALHPDEAEDFNRFIVQARTHLATKAKQQKWIRDAGSVWRIFTSKYNPD